jgi:hypothetical protein
MGKAARLKAVQPQALLKLDLGCGNNRREGFIGVDERPFPKVDQVVDLTTLPWPWKDGSVGEAHASHFVEHLTGRQRVDFVNELYRVLVIGGTCQMITPHWASARAYGDYTHQWPPVSEFWFYYLDKNWRAANAPHNDAYQCDFLATWGYALRGDLPVRNQEYQQYALMNYKEAAQDLIATLTKR